MNISNYSVITKSDNPYAQSRRIPADGQGRQRVRGNTEAPAERVQAVVPVGDVYSSQRRADFYQVEDLSRYTSTQRKALQTYSANQGLSMLDANADYLGAIDTFA